MHSTQRTGKIIKMKNRVLTHNLDSRTMTQLGYYRPAYTQGILNISTKLLIILCLIMENENTALSPL